MCGLLLYKSSDLMKNSHICEDFKTALSLIAHRGPDATSIILKKEINTLIGFQRLEIRDIHFGSQPMEDEENKIILTFNGEIFNDDHLKNELIKKGHIFKTENSDTEVILRGYIEWGTNIFKKLRGFFAIVIIDNSLKKIFLARDFNGIKPLYYYIDKKNTLIIASELSPINHLTKDELIETESAFYTLAMITPPVHKNIYKNIKTVKPGSILEIDLLKNEVIKDKLFNYKYLTYDINTNFEDVIIDTSKNWLKSDVEIALTLSGGIDSSLLAVLTKKLNPKIKAFSLVFDEPMFEKWNESKQIRKLADQINLDLTEVKINFDTVGETIENIISNLDQPFCGSFAPWFVFNEISKKDIKVAITGSGGDELFGNYERAETFHSEFILNGKVKSKKVINKLFQLNGYNILKHIIDPKIEKIVKSDLSRLTKLRSNYTKQISIYRKIADICSFLELSGEFLYFEDRLSMLNNVETRPIFLDNMIRNYLIRNDHLCFNQKIYKNTLVKIIQKYVHGWEPKEKKGHSLPVSFLMRGPMKSKLLNVINEDYMNYIGLIDFKEIEQTLEDFFKGSNFNVQIIWSLFTLHLWFKSKEFKSISKN